MKYASFFQRLVAWMIEWQLSALVVVVTFLIASLGVKNVPSLTNSIVISLTVYLWVALISGPYYAFFTSKFGGTIGKLIVGIKVVDQTKTNHLSFWMAYFRGTIGYMVSSFVFGLGYFWMWRNPDKKNWHDFIVDSRVVTVQDTGVSHTAFGVVALLALFFANTFCLLAIFGNIFSNNDLQFDWHSRFESEATSMLKSH